MFISTPILRQSQDLVWHVSKRNFISKLFKCGCFGGKDKDTDKIEAPPLTLKSKLESNGMCMPILGLGTWQIHKNQMKPAVITALEYGYRHFDTSHITGEVPLGEALECVLQCGKYKREELFVTSKLPHYANCPQQVEYFVDKTLEHLKLKYIDLYLIHFPVGVEMKEGSQGLQHSQTAVPHVDHAAIWKALEYCVSCGKIKSIGLSNFNERQVTNILHCATIPPTNLQIELHLYCQQKSLRKLCKENGIVITAYAPLGSPGLRTFLTNHGLHPKDVPEPLKNYSVLQISKAHRKVPAQILLRHLLQLGVVVIPKSCNPDRIITNSKLFDFCLSNCEMKELATFDVGEAGRMFGCNIWSGTSQHPEYPFEDR